MTQFLKWSTMLRRTQFVSLVASCLLQLAQAEDNKSASRRVVGRATFSDGSPVANSLLRFYLLSSDAKPLAAGSTQQVDCTTADDGHFEITLPAIGRYTAKALAYENGEAANTFPRAIARRTAAIERPKLSLRKN